MKNICTEIKYSVARLTSDKAPHEKDFRNGKMELRT